MFGGVKCVLSGKKCRKTDAECPDYKDSCYFSDEHDPEATQVNMTEAGDDGEPRLRPRFVVIDGECRYRGVERWNKKKFLDREFLRGGRECRE